MQKTVISLDFSVNERSEIAIQALSSGSIEGLKNVENKIDEAIERAKSYEGFHGMNGSLTYMVTKSVKQKNNWQLTCFNKAMQPLSDHQYQEKEKALKELIEVSNKEVEAITL